MAIEFAILLAAAIAAPEPRSAPAHDGLRSDARSIERLVNQNYAYLERLPDGRMIVPPKLRAEAERIETKKELVRYSERVLSLLADHHAITGSSLGDSWAVFPSFGDLWVDRNGDRYIIEQVRVGSPAEVAGIRAGDRLVAVAGVPTSQAVAGFWADLGTSGGGERDGFAARVLAAGKRDRPRHLSIQSGSAAPRALTLSSLYSLHTVDRPTLSARRDGAALAIRFHDSLGDSATIAAFDAAMASARPAEPIVIDLTDTPSGGNTTVARAVLGWFVDKPTPYQIHNLPAEERETGVARQWVEQVLPRAGKFRRGPIVVRVGRWTGSMGEGIAIAFDSIGARVEGSPMAGLLGAVYDYTLPESGQVLKLPTERLCAVDGTPRERFVPEATGVGE